MTSMTSRVKVIAVIAGVSMVVAGLAAIAVGAVVLVEGTEPIQLTAVSGPDISIPHESTILGGSVMLYTPAPVDDPLVTRGCELERADGRLTSTTRIDSIAAAVSDPVTADGATWHPLVQIDVLPETSTLRCPGLDLTSAALSQEKTFGQMTTFIGLFALGSGLVGLALGCGAILIGRYLPR